MTLNIQNLLEQTPEVVALVGSRIQEFPMPVGVDLPAITHQVVSSTSPATLVASSTLHNQRIQITCVANKQSTAVQLADAVAGALADQDAVVFKSAEAAFDKDSQTSRMVLDYSVWR